MAPILELAKCRCQYLAVNCRQKVSECHVRRHLFPVFRDIYCWYYHIETVEEEIGRLKRLWGPMGGQEDHALARLLGDRLHDIDRFDHAQLCEMINTCRNAKSLSEAGCMLFAVSRKRRSTTNDADRLRKYLARFDLTWEEVAERA